MKQDVLVLPGDELLGKRIDLYELLLFPFDQEVVDPAAGLQRCLQSEVALDEHGCVLLDGGRRPG